jgi:hypothetical protein
VLADSKGFARARHCEPDHPFHPAGSAEPAGGLDVDMHTSEELGDVAASPQPASHREGGIKAGPEEEHLRPQGANRCGANRKRNASIQAGVGQATFHLSKTQRIVKTELGPIRSTND